MKLFVQARKDGYNVLYPNPPAKDEFYQFARDIQHGNANNDNIYYGKSFYSLAFTGNGCIFSRFTIGYDVQRNYLGNIGISVFIPSSVKLSGLDVINMLDELMNTYWSNYCPNNVITNSSEEWPLLIKILDRYSIKIHHKEFDDIDNLQSGELENAVIYYKNTFELQKFFDYPFQEEYAPYKQIIYVMDDLRGKPENPLNVLIHSGNDLTGKIDLDNPFYKLREYHKTGKNGIEIKIKNSKGRELFNKDKVYRKEEITVVYSKKYYHEKRIVGSLLNNEELRKYLVVSSDNKIDVAKEINLDPETKTIKFIFRTKKDFKEVPDAEIRMSEYQDWQRLSEYTFKADELGKEFNISARKSKDNLTSKIIRIKPKDHAEDSVILELIEKKTLYIKALDQGNGNPIWDFKVHITGKDFYRVTDKCDFYDDEIDKEWNIQIEKHPEYFNSFNYKYCPAKDGDEIVFHLKRKPKESTPSTASETNGRNTNSDVNSGPNISRVKSFFSRSKVIASLILITLMLIIGIFALRHFRVKDNQYREAKLTDEKITAYVKGDSLMLNKLRTYKEDWEKQKPEIESSGGFVWYNPMTWFVGGNETSLDSTNYKEWSNTLSSIDHAIDLRNLLNEKNFSELKKFSFSSYQDSIKTAVERIDNTQYTIVKKELNDVSYLTLTQIAKSINKILQDSKIENFQEINTDNLSTDDVETDTKKTSKNNSRVNSPADNNSLKSDTGNVASSKGGYEKTNQEKQQAKFQKEFWDIVYKDNPEKKDFDEWYKSGSKISAQNEFKVFYDKYLSKTSAYKKIEDFFKQPARDKKQKVRTLEDLIKEIE